MSNRVRSAAALLFVLVGGAPSMVKAQIEEGRIPLQTALTELFRFRESYAETYNRKDVAGVAAMYDTSAVVILPNGSILKGRAAVAKSLGDAAPLPHLVIESDSLRVFGNTAIDVGTVKMHPSGAPEIVTRYMVVLRRGFNEWRLVYASQTPVTN